MSKLLYFIFLRRHLMKKFFIALCVATFAVTPIFAENTTLSNMQDTETIEKINDISVFRSNIINDGTVSLIFVKNSGNFKQTIENISDKNVLYVDDIIKEPLDDPEKEKTDVNAIIDPVNFKVKLDEEVYDVKNIVLTNSINVKKIISANLNTEYYILQKNATSDEIDSMLKKSTAQNVFIERKEEKITANTLDMAERTLTPGQYTKVVLDVPYISQIKPVAAWVGCEPVSLLMGLKYKGYATDVSTRQFLDAMPKTSSNPAKGFVGSPYTPNKNLRTTIDPEPLARYGQNYGTVYNIQGASMDDIIYEIESGNPVVIYVTLYWRKPYYRTYNVEGTRKTFLRNNHAVLLDGYDPATDSFHISDPYNHEKAGGNRNKPFRYWKKRSVVEPLYNVRKYAVVVR